MTFYADLHIHSKYSRATSRDCDLENLAIWGRKKGITVIGTGDFTHPAWMKEIKEKLIPAENGLYQLRPDIEKKIAPKIPGACQGKTRFMLSVEISTIYKKGSSVRKIHHLIFAPSIEKTEAINRKLETIGNIRSDGRPILGLDSRHLLEIVLEEGGEGAFLVPAHIWTPWFAVLGSKSGFDSVAECYDDLADHVFAVETGLSSDPLMNWRVSSLDRYRLISNSDAHSPQKLGREACIFDTPLDYFSMREALATGNHYGGTLEFFPEEGKYHLDGHRNCKIRFSPQESKKHNGLCPSCGSPLTLGVLYRVEELADRPENQSPKNASPYQNMIPLPEILGELLQTGSASKSVLMRYEKLLQHLGPEIEILNHIPVETIQNADSGLLAEALKRMRCGQVIREGGYDGEYGIIRLFKENELQDKKSAGILFEIPKKETSRLSVSKKKEKTDLPVFSEPSSNQIRGEIPQGIQPLDPEQTKAVEILKGPLLITAGPGSGKTRVLTQRIASLIQRGLANPGQCLALTFSRRAADEMRERLETLLKAQAKDIPVMTFHGFCLQILSRHYDQAGLQENFILSTEDERADFIRKELAVSSKKAAKLISELTEFKRAFLCMDQASADLKAAILVLEKARQQKGWIDFDDLLLYTIRLLKKNPDLGQDLTSQYSFVSVDEFQDLDSLQFALLKLLVPPEGNLCAIGDPDQAIYGFRGADVRFFLEFNSSWPSAQKIQLIRNYRSQASIVHASHEMMTPMSLVPNRPSEAMIPDTSKLIIHSAKSDKAEAIFLAETIEKMIGGLNFYFKDSGKTTKQESQGYGFSDFAILCRTEAQLPLIEEALQFAGIPFQKRSHQTLSENPFIKKILNELGSITSEQPLDQKLEQLQKDWKDEVYAPYFSRLTTLLETCEGNPNLFYSQIKLTREFDTLDPRADRVALLTLHASKGLEFPVVMIPGCEDGFFPLNWGNQLSDSEIAEERRLFFVGMTRAKEKLILSYTGKRILQGALKDRAISPFMESIQEAWLEKTQTQLKAKIKPIPQLELFERC